MERRNPNMGRPHFFKPILPTRNSQQLNIPVLFLDHIIHENSRSFSLMGPSENVWKVLLIKNTDDHYFFGEGWPEFVRDHDLVFGDICVFVYEGDLNFKVQIFNQRGCEKESAYHAVCSQDCNRSKRDKGKMIGRSEAVKVPKASLYESRRSLPRKTANMAANVTKVAELHSGWKISHRRHVTEVEKERVYEAAMQFESRNPFTVIVMRSSYVYTGSSLPMPISFRNFLPDTGGEIILKDRKGTTWPVTYMVYTKPKIQGKLSRGWNAFSYYNNIEEDDACVFELIRKNEMQVHIFRVVEKVTPLTKHSIRKRTNNYGSSDTTRID